MVIHRTKHKSNKSRHINKIINININSKIINILSTVKKYYEIQKNTIHINAYDRAIYQIKHWSTPITKGSELSHLVGIGKGMIEKIDTIIATGTLPIIKEKRLDISLDNTLDTINNKTKKKNNKLQSLNTHILGFGETIMKELKNKYGVRTINDIRKLVMDDKVKLNKTQKIGLKYYEDLTIPIPREEIADISNIIKNIVEKYFIFLKCFLAGSYPSGTKKESKDIDMLIVVNDDVYGGLKNVINTISKYISLETISIGDTKFMGIIKSPISDKWRHLDIRMVGIDNLPYAWLYFTGGKIFNKLIRERLKKKGYKLNEYGLYKNYKDTIKIELDNKYLDKFGLDKNLIIKINEKQMLEYIEYFERKIFEIADLEYKTVKERY